MLNFLYEILNYYWKKESIAEPTSKPKKKKLTKQVSDVGYQGADRRNESVPSSSSVLKIGI